MTLTGLAAFGEDEGTLWLDPDGGPLPLSELQRSRRWWRWTLKRRLRNRALVWFIDDEQANREWFVKHHRFNFALLTFSGRNHVLGALQARTPCDVLVTDLFFPARLPRSDVEADRLLQIYDEIDRTAVTALDALWRARQTSWSLDGFDIAKDVAAYAVLHHESIPVVFFSRKATLLLNIEDWLWEPSVAVENTHWMLEKVDPSEKADRARRAASIQRDRITAALKYAGKSLRWPRKVLNVLTALAVRVLAALVGG